jgi:hypothetical protein
MWAGITYCCSCRARSSCSANDVLRLLNSVAASVLLALAQLYNITAVCRHQRATANRSLAATFPLQLLVIACMHQQLQRSPLLLNLCCVGIIRSTPVQILFKRGCCDCPLHLELPLVQNAAQY